jgi:ABC-type polysaccharide/polyol phosphate export permease
LLLPVVVAFLFCLVLGLSMLVAVLHAHFRDVEPVLAAGLLPWFFLTPLFLPVEDFPGIGDHELIGDLLEWGNPVAPFVHSVRTILWAGTAPDVAHLAYVAGAGLVSLALGVLVFRRMERDLAVVL